MPPRILRLLLLAALVVVGAGGVFWTWMLAQYVSEVDRAGRQTVARIDRVETLLDELARLELTHAAGRVDSGGLSDANTRLRQLVSESSSVLRDAVASSSSPARALSKESSRLQEAIHGAAESAAALLTETSRTRQSLRDHFRALRRAESDAIADARASAVERAWPPLAAVALVFAWALIRSSRAAVKPQSDSGSVAANPALAPADGPPLQASAPALDLAETAALCSAIARLQSEAGLADLLSRTGRLLEASGVVVWMGAGEELFPVAGYGYDPAQWHLLGPISGSARNATAAAWRSGTLVTVAGDRSARAAIVAPLLGAERCVGVFAVELVPGRESDPSTQAAVTLVAAQLAAVLVAWPPASSHTAMDRTTFERASASAS